MWADLRLPRELGPFQRTRLAAPTSHEPVPMQDYELPTIGGLRNWQRSAFGDNRFGGCALLALGVRSGCCARLGGTSVLCLLGQRRKVSRETRYRSSDPSCPYSPKCPEGGFFKVRIHDPAYARLLVVVRSHAGGCGELYALLHRRPRPLLRGFFRQKCSRGATTSGSSLSRTRLTGVA